MIDRVLVALYVRDIEKTVQFYRDLLGIQPVRLMDNYAQFPLGAGVDLGLWRESDVLPLSDGSGCRSEICFPVATAADVAACYGRWQSLGVMICEPPVQHDFGTAFLACDPDGHRLRVLAPPG